MNLSIITATYNSEDCIEQTIKSVKEQKHSPKEHIFIDGASTDGTLSIIEQNQQDYSKIVSEKDNGIYDAFNKGVKLATGKYISFLNADDNYVSNFSEIVQPLLEHDYDIIQGDVALINTDGTLRFVKQPKPDSVWFKGRYLNHPATIIKRQIFEDYGYFNTKYKISADIDWFLNLWKYKPSYHYTSERLTDMRIGGVSYQPKINVENYKIRKKHLGMPKALVFMGYYSSIQILRSIKHKLG